MTKIFCLQYIDLTLISANAATDILATIVLSVWLLKEKFIWRYDLPALFFFVVGGVLIVISANTTETDYTPDDVKDILKAPKTIIFLILCVVFNVISAALLNYILHKLRLFEKDVDDYHEENAITGDAMILPAREKK